MRRAIYYAVVGVVGWLLAGLVPGAAQAGELPAQPWQVLDTATNGTRAPSAHSKIVSASVAEATWKAGEPASSGGTSIETANLALPVKAGDKVTVGYELVDGASPAAGAVRLFYYDKPDANTLTEAPTKFAYVPNDGPTSGTLTIEVEADGVVGTAGLVYDTSNGGVPGTVRFASLKVAGKAVDFVAPPPPARRNDPPVVSPPSAGSPTSAAPTSGVGNADTLPVTGSEVARPLLIGGVLLVASGVALLLAWRQVYRTPGPSPRRY